MLTKFLLYKDSRRYAIKKEIKQEHAQSCVSSEMTGIMRNDVQYGKKLNKERRQYSK